LFCYLSKQLFVSDLKFFAPNLFHGFINFMNKLDEKSPSQPNSGFDSRLDSESPNLGDRLRKLWSHTGLRQEDFATRLGITTVTLQNYFKNIRLPNSDFIKQTCTEFSVLPEWLLWGTGPMLRGNAQVASAEAQTKCLVPSGEPQWMAPDAAPTMGYTLVPKVKARLAAGTGSLETEGEIVGYYAFKTDFLTRKGHAKRMVLMDVLGDSMEPEIWNGDTVLLDESQNEILAGGLFAVGIDQEVFVKYLDKVPGKLILRSKNPAYAPIEVNMNGQLSDAVRIIGRVVWSCREYVR
jgi:phage repressor protein C with HTH and peptisase S24 domain